AADVELLDDRDLARGGEAVALALGVVQAHLPLELVGLVVWFKYPGAGQPRGAQDRLVVVRRQPEGRSRALRRQQGEPLLVQAEAMALRGHGLALEQSSYDVELLLEDVQALLGQPERVVLLL